MLLGHEHLHQVPESLLLLSLEPGIVTHVALQDRALFLRKRLRQDLARVFGLATSRTSYSSPSSKHPLGRANQIQPHLLTIIQNDGFSALRPRARTHDSGLLPAPAGRATGSAGLSKRALRRARKDGEAPSGARANEGAAGLSQSAKWLYEDAPFCLLAHSAEQDPRFTYANQTALRLFEYSPEELLGLPSRLSAEPDRREERERLIRDVKAQGYASGYRGLRVAKSGRRFWIEDVTMWNLLDAQGAPCGQAAMYRRTTLLDESCLQ